MKTIRKATTTEIVKIHDLLKTHLILLDAVDRDDHRLVRYTEGFNDEILAKLVSPDLAHNAVGRIRVEMFGKLVGATPAEEGCLKFEKRLIRLEDRLSALTESVAELIQQLGGKT